MLSISYRYLSPNCQVRSSIEILFPRTKKMRHRPPMRQPRRSRSNWGATQRRPPPKAATKRRNRRKRKGKRRRTCRRRTATRRDTTTTWCECRRPRRIPTRRLSLRLPLTGRSSEGLSAPFGVSKCSRRFPKKLWFPNVLWIHLWKALRIGLNDLTDSVAPVWDS